MAQTGYTPILIYSSSTASNLPSASNLTNSTLGSELAINIADGKLFYKDTSNAIQVIGWKVRPATAGGTGLTSFAVGDLLYADTTTTLAKLADVATGNALISGGVGVAPSWGKIGLTTHVSGVLPTANGGTNLSSFTANGVLYASSTSALATGSSLLFDGTAFTVGTTSIGNARIALQASASNDANEPELNFYSAVFANLNKPKAKSANGTLALLLESGSTSTFQKRARLRLDGGGAATATIQTSTDNGSTYTDQLTLAGATGDVTVNTGNLVVGTSGKGINTSAAHRFTFNINGAEKGQFTAGGYFKATDNGSYGSTTGTFHEFYQSADNHALIVKSVNATQSADVLVVQGDRNTTNNSYYVIQYYNTGGAVTRFRVADSGNVTNTNGSYGTISDAKIKQDIIDAPSQWDDIKNLQLRKYRLKSEASDNPDAPMYLGLVAQEVEAVSPGLVEQHQDKDADNNNLGTVTKSIKTSILYMKAVKALQEAMARIELLETQVQELKGK